MRKFFIIFLEAIVVFLGSCSHFSLPKESIESVVFENCHNADSKFIDDKVMTSYSGRLTLFDSDLNIFRQYDVNSDWFDSYKLDGKNYIISGNFQNETWITILDEEYEVIDCRKIMDTNLLAIDQAIFYLNDIFYFTVTEIEGKVNNTDPDGENGTYTLKLYKTKDFNKVEYVKDVVSMKRNVEDIELFSIDGKLACCYEVESAHTKKSTLCLRTSKEDLLDYSKDLVSDGDDEPAKMMQIGSHWYLFYASDLNHEGQSYDGSDMFCIEMNSKFEIIKKCQLPSLNEGIHLYDVKYTNNEFKMLYSIHYYEGRDLVVETLK